MRLNDLQEYPAKVPQIIFLKYISSVIFMTWLIICLNRLSPFNHFNVREHRKGVGASSGIFVFTCIGSNVTYNQFSCGSIFIIQCIAILYVVFMLYVCVRGQWCQTGLDYMSKMWVSYKRQKLSTLCEHMGPFRFLMRSVLLIFFRHVSSLPYVAIVSELSILDCPFGFLYRLL